MLHCYVGILINHDIRIPIKQPAFNGMSCQGFLGRGSIDVPGDAEMGTLELSLVSPYSIVQTRNRKRSSQEKEPPL